jgi:hypothetical protein
VPVARSRLTADEIDERINAAIRENYDEFLSPLLARVIAHAQDTEASNLETAFQKLRTEMSKLEAELAQLRALFFTEQAAKAEKNAPASVDPPLLRHRTQVNWRGCMSRRGRSVEPASWPPLKVGQAVLARCPLCSSGPDDLYVGVDVDRSVDPTYLFSLSCFCDCDPEKVADELLQRLSHGL